MIAFAVALGLLALAHATLAQAPIKELEKFGVKVVTDISTDRGPVYFSGAALRELRKQGSTRRSWARPFSTTRR